jgi:hypothetical protein
MIPSPYALGIEPVFWQDEGKADGPRDVLPLKARAAVKELANADARPKAPVQGVWDVSSRPSPCRLSGVRA